MSVQVFLQGKLLGIEEFLSAPAHPADAAGAGVCGEALFAGRSQWATLLSEVLPRALLAELGLAKVLLGSSGGGQFFVVLPEEFQERAKEFLEAAARQVGELSGGTLRLVWALTENLGDWAVVRRRLDEAMRPLRSAPARNGAGVPFAPFEPTEPVDAAGYFTEAMGVKLRQASEVGWSAEQPGRVLLEEGTHRWPVGGPEGIPLARHTAPSENGEAPASPPELAERAEGRKSWGVLRGDVDSFEGRMRRLTSVEEHIQLSLMYKQFFAGEVEVLCSMPEFWRKVSVLYTGGDDFALCGSWDALIPVAREVQRLFHRFNEESLKDVPGAEGKTISMAIAFAAEPETPLLDVFLEAGRRLELAKSADRDSLHLFNRAVEWRHLTHAVELKDSLGRMVRDFGFPPEFLGDMLRFYDERTAAGGATSGRFDRPWRYHRRLQLWAGDARDREFQRLRNRLIVNLIGKDAAHAQLRPAGGVALQWAKLLHDEA